MLITAQVAGDGRSDWLKGVQLLSVYLVLAITFFFVPAAVSALTIRPPRQPSLCDPLALDRPSFRDQSAKTRSCSGYMPRKDDR